MKFSIYESVEKKRVEGRMKMLENGTFKDALQTFLFRTDRFKDVLGRDLSLIDDMDQLIRLRTKASAASAAQELIEGRMLDLVEGQSPVDADVNALINWRKKASFESKLEAAIDVKIVQVLELQLLQEVDVNKMATWHRALLNCPAARGLIEKRLIEMVGEICHQEVPIWFIQMTKSPGLIPVFLNKSFVEKAAEIFEKL